MRKAVLYSSLAGCFGLAVLLEALVTEAPEEVPENRLVLELGGDAPRTIPEEPPEHVSAKSRPLPEDPGPGGNGAPNGAGADPDRPPPPDPSPEQGTWEYTVQAGDSLWTIARDQLGAGPRFGEILQRNGLKEADVLAEGKVLKMPPRDPSAEPDRAPPVLLDDRLRTHTVQEGETLGEIAARYLGSAARYPEIQALNGIEDPARVRAGTVLRIPDA